MPSAPPLPRCPVCGFVQQAELKPTADTPAHCGRPSCGVEFLSCDGEHVRLRTFRLVDGYSLCVLPFAFTEAERGDACRRLDASGRWRPRTFSLDDPDDVERTEYFLPYIRRFLFPSLYPEAGADDRTRKEPPCRHYEFDLARLGPADRKGLPLTLRCHDSRKNLGFAYGLLLESVQLIVFSYRVGFLVLRFRCADEAATYFDQMNALVYLRSIAPLYRGFEMAELTSGAAGFRIPQLLPYLLAEFGRDALPAAPADVPAGAPLPVKPIYDDRMMVYTFSCLDKESCLADPERCQALLQQATVVNFDPDSTAPPRLKQPEDDVSAWLRTRWQGFSKEGGSLVVFNTDRFHERFLGVYHGTYYFDVFLLATLQRVTLLNLFERLSDIQALTTGSLRSGRLLRRVRLDLLLFKNQCWFSQITNRERGLQLWKKWQEVLETRTLMDEVNEQSGELDTYLRSRMRERVEWLVRLGGFLAAAVPAVFGLEALLGAEEWVRNLRWVLVALLVVGAGIFGWFVVFRRGDEA
jgi:hypothetical protein